MDRIEDRLEICDLTARYAYYVDTFQADKIMTLWSEEAIFDETRVGTGLHKGTAGIRAFFGGLKKTITHQAHITSNHLIEEIDDISAKRIVFCIVAAVTIAGNMRGVVYDADDHARLHGRWVFRSRVIYPILPFDTAAYDKANAEGETP